ncbi:MAG: selenide, water dikinase SelD [Alicyclobacillus sp. RIFOXYA1_FULL_53_8]|nr:MAG: selenide, water dikinase SelD [Alicyclobacillus sp. RIFOXYA1_FULL_53_8]
MQPLLTQQSLDSNLLIGLDEPDDAAVYQLTDDLAVILTADFITPVVDDAYAWGAIAATNSISDVYAMGGKPLIALNLVGFPKDIPPEIAQRVIQGGLDKAREAGVLIVGGHTVQDEEPKFGMAVLGLVHPNRIIRKGGAEVGDKLVLTKPIGSGLLAKCGKSAAVPEEHLQAAQEHMLTSNRVASETAVRHLLKSGTDVTGFGLLGHAVEMAEAAQVQFRFSFKAVPILGGAMDQAQEGSHWPSKTWENEEYFSSHISFPEHLNLYQKYLLYSPETSGGLLLAVPAAKLDVFLSDLHEHGGKCWVIGDVTAGNGITIQE